MKLIGYINIQTIHGYTTADRQYHWTRLSLPYILVNLNNKPLIVSNHPQL